MDEVYNITDPLPGHNHPGDPSYIMYTEGCRHPNCLVAFQDYKLRLAQRKLSGEYVDLRRREHRLRVASDQFAEQHRPVDREPVNGGPEPVAREQLALPKATTDPPSAEAVREPLSAADALLALAISVADPNGNLPGDILSAVAMARELGIRDAEAQAAIHELWGKDITMGAGTPKLVRRP